MMVILANDGFFKANDGKMLVNNGEMLGNDALSKPSFAYLTIIEKLHRLHLLAV